MYNERIQALEYAIAIIESKLEQPVCVNRDVKIRHLKALQELVSREYYSNEGPR